MTHYVLDLETTGVSPGCGILSIACVPIDPKLFPFYASCFIGSNKEVGLRFEKSTMDWWAHPSLETLFEEFQDPEKDSVSTIIYRFATWLKITKEAVPGMRIWGNGALFDWGILEAAATQLGIALNFDSRHVYCYRTLKSLLNRVEQPPFDGTPHYAPHDARHEGKHLKLLLAELAKCKQI